MNLLSPELSCKGLMSENKKEKEIPRYYETEFTEKTSTPPPMKEEPEMAHKRINSMVEYLRGSTGTLKNSQ